MRFQLPCPDSSSNQRQTKKAVEADILVTEETMILSYAALTSRNSSQKSVPSRVGLINIRFSLLSADTYNFLIIRHRKVVEDM